MPLQPGMHRHDAAHGAHGPVPGVVNLLDLFCVHGLPHLPGRPEHEQAECGQGIRPEHLHQPRARRHKDHAHDECAQYAIIQNPVLHVVAHTKGGENRHDHKEVVYREGFLKQVASQKELGLLAAELPPDVAHEGHGQAHPDG